MTSRENYDTTWKFSNSWREQLKAQQYIQGKKAKIRQTKEESHLFSTHTIHCASNFIVQIKQNVLGKDESVSFHEPFLEYMANVYGPMEFLETVSKQSPQQHTQQQDMLRSTLNYMNPEASLPPNRDFQHQVQYRMTHKYFVFRKNSRARVQWKLKIIHYDEFGNELEVKELQRIGNFSLEDLEWLVMRDLGEESSVLADLQRQHRVAREMYDLK